MSLIEEALKHSIDPSIEAWEIEENEKTIQLQHTLYNCSILIDKKKRIAVYFPSEKILSL